VSKYHCSACGVELTPWIQTPCPNSESGLHSINDEDFKAHKIERQKEWERLQVEAGVPTFEPSADEMLDWLDANAGTMPQFNKWAVSQGRVVRSTSPGMDLRQAIRAAMKAEADR